MYRSFEVEVCGLSDNHETFSMKHFYSDNKFQVCEDLNGECIWACGSLAVHLLYKQ